MTVHPLDPTRLASTGRELTDRNADERFLARMAHHPGPGKLRLCPRCHETKRAISFYRDRRNRNGLTTYCKACRKDIMDLYRSRRPGYNSSYNKRRRQELYYIKALLRLSVMWETRYGTVFLRPPPPLHLPVDSWITQIKKEFHP